MRGRTHTQSGVPPRFTSPDALGAFPFPTQIRQMPIRYRFRNRRGSVGKEETRTVRARPRVLLMLSERPTTRTPGNFLQEPARHPLVQRRRCLQGKMRRRECKQDNMLSTAVTSAANSKQQRGLATGHCRVWGHPSVLSYRYNS